MMRIEEQVCSLELAKRLKELGVKQDSLWYWCPTTTNSTYSKYFIIFKNTDIENDELYKSQICSAFTVAELGEMLPKKFGSLKGYTGAGGFICFDDDEKISASINEKEANARAIMIIKLIENGFIKVKDELKDIVKIAKQIATEGHKGQKRWDGKEYITHPEAVAKLVNTPELKIVAWLHDIIEDTNITAKDLLNKGIPKYLVEMVEAISKHKGEDYSDFIIRCKHHPITRKVKIADLTHNLSDLKNGSMRDKYMLARYVLSEEKEDLKNGDEDGI